MLASLQTTSLYFLDWNLERIARCVEALPEDRLWTRPNGNSLSVGNQILHLAGNIRQWLVSGLGGQPDVRRRDEEFSTPGGLSAEQLMDLLTDVVEDAKLVVSDLTVENLARERPVQAFHHDGLFILIHAIEHFSYHTGQVIFYTKAELDVDLNFYGDVDLTRKGVEG